MAKKKKKKPPKTPSLPHNKHQNEQVGLLKKMGFSSLGANSRGDITMQAISKDGFVEQYTVDIYGRVRRYKPWKPSLNEKARLSNLSTHENYLLQSRRSKSRTSKLQM